VRDGLIAELDGGKFTITDEGRKELTKKDEFKEELEDQLSLVNKLGFSMFAAGKWIADEAIDHISSISTTAWDKLTNRSPGAQRSFEEKYEQFLLSELDKLNHKKMQNSQIFDDEQ
jgi:hypothetical protein